jgi:hypothetical protein
MSCTGTYDWEFVQGEDAVLQLTYKDDAGVAINLTGYTARSQGRESYVSSNTLFDATTGNSQISIDEPNGVITITIPASETANITAPQTGVWDIEIISSGGAITNLLGGRLKIKPNLEIRLKLQRRLHVLMSVRVRLLISLSRT